jgi:hypothetical protein
VDRVTGRHHLVMTGRHHADKQQDDRVPPELWPKDDDRNAAEDTKVLHPVVVAQDDAPVLGPVSLVEQERADHSARVAELHEEIRRTPRWQLVRLVAVVGVFLAAIVLALVLTGCTTTTAGDPHPVSTSLMQPEPEEDEPGFDCHTMRNRVCGPTEVRA